MYDPGELDQILKLQTETGSADGMGGTVKSWADTASPAPVIRALVRPMTGNERLASQQVESNSNYLIVMRPRTISEKQRLVWTSVSPNIVFNIRFIKRKPRARYLEIEAEIADV